MAMAIEEEVKLTATTVATLDAVAADPAVLAGAQGGSLRSRNFLATYYDTPDRLLLRHCLAFRLRQGSDGMVTAGLKGTGGMVDGVSRRQEWEERLAAPLTRLDDLPAGELRTRMLAVVAPDSLLVPLLVTDFQRRLLVLHLEGSRAEMALDQGEVRAGGAVHHLCEVELERLAGAFAPLQRFAADLARRHALVPSQRSKFGLGLALLGLQEEV